MCVHVGGGEGVGGLVGFSPQPIQYDSSHVKEIKWEKRNNKEIRKKDVHP